jgi:dihydrodipicolinate synthase/N-acetylneuraminate lyase
VPPYYAPLTPDELRGHLRAVAAAVDVPIVYYHIPSCTKVALDADAIVALGRQAGFAAAKDSSGDAATLTRLLTAHRDAFLTFAGWDALCLQAFTLGARAAILGAATILPDACAALLDAVDRGRPDDASATWRRLAPVLDFCAANGYVGAAKAACGLLGIPVGVPRPPLGALGPEQTAALAGLLRDAGFAREVSGAPAGA